MELFLFFPSVFVTGPDVHAFLHIFQPGLHFFLHPLFIHPSFWKTLKLLEVIVQLKDPTSDVGWMFWVDVAPDLVFTELLCHLLRRPLPAGHHERPLGSGHQEPDHPLKNFSLGRQLGGGESLPSRDGDRS